MNYSQIAILFLQGTLVAFAILLLFRLRRRLGIGVLFACLGLFQFVQVFLTSTVYVSITNNFFVSPGSSVFFTASLFALLIIYIKEDASETKKIIYALFIVNVIMAIILQTLGWNLEEVSTQNPFNVSTGLFDISGKVLVIGTIALFLDSLLIIALFEFISKRVRFLFLQICLTMLIVVSFDTAFFSILALSNFDNLTSIIIAGLISKGVFVVFYSILFYVYLKYFDLKERESSFLKTEDVFKFRAVKQKLESAESEIKKAEEMYRILTDHSTDLICLHKPDSTFKYISPSIKNLLGYDQSEFLGKKIFELLHNDDIQDLQDSIDQKVFSNGVVDIVSCRVRHKDGHFIWLEILISSVFKEHEISYFVSTGRDVTERVVANQKIKDSLKLLEKSEYSLSKASRMAKIGYWEYDNEKGLLTWSDYVYRIYGLDPKEDTLSREEMLVFFDKESQKRLLDATSNLDSRGIPYDIELKLINRRKEEVWIRTIVQPVYNQQNEIIGRRGVLHNITESKKIQLKLSTSLELLEKSEFSKNKASKMAKIGYWECDVATDTIVWSDSIYSVFGYESNEEIPSRNEILALYDKESQKNIEQANLELNSTGIPYDLELRLINLRKEEVWVRNVVQPIYNEQNEIIGRRGVLQDITVSKLKQNELDQQSEKLYELNNALNDAQELAHVGSWYHDLSSQKSTWSDETFRIWGFDSKKPMPEEDEILGRIHKDDLELFNTATELVFNEGASYDIEYRICLDNDKIKTVRSICKPIFGDDGNIVSLNGINQDITEQKLRENELDQQTKKLHKLNIALNDAQGLAHVGSWFYDLSSQKSEWSDETFRLWGFDSKKPIPELDSFLSKIHKDDLALFNKATELVYQEGSSYDIEYRICLNDDEIKTIRSICKPIFGDDGTIVSLNGVNQDITEQKRKQDELDQQTKTLNKLNIALNDAQKLSHIGSWQWNMATDEAEWSDEMYNIYGVTKENFYPSNENVMKTVLPEDLHKVEKGISSLLIDKMFVPFEFRIKRPSGEIRNVYIMALEINSKEIIFGVTKDITERKIIEEENLRIKNSYISLFDNATISIWNEDFTEVYKEINELRKLDIPNIIIYLEENPGVLSSLISKVVVNSVNKATLKLFKAKSSQDFFNNIDTTFGEGADKVFIMLVESIWTNKKSFTSEVNYKKLNGDEFVALFSIPIPQTEAEQKTIPISIQSIQSIKDAESAKRESIKDLNAAQEIARVGSWFFNVLTKESEWSEETYRIWGFNVNEITPNEELIQNRIHIDDRELFLNAAELVYNKKVPYDIEYRICLPNDEEKWIRSICRPVLDDNGDVVLLKGTNQDITEKKRASDEIEKAEELYRLLTDHSNDIICLQEPDSTFKYMSPSIKKVLGYEPSEFIGKQIFNIIHKDDIESLKDAIEQKVFSREIADNVNSFRARHKDGYYVWLEYLTSPVYIENEISYFVTSARDITQRVKANEIVKTSLDLLEKSESSKNEASKMAKIGYWEYDIETDTFIWSDYLYQIYGLDLKDEIPSRTKIISLYDKESKEKIAQAIEKVGVKTPSYDLELKFTNLKNEEVWERSVVQAVYNEKNEIVGRRGVMQDITDSKKAQFQLERSKKEIESSLELLETKEYSLKQTSSIAKIGYWEYDIATDFFTWSEYVYSIYGLDLNEKIPSRKGMVAFYDKESQDKLAQATINLDLDGVPYDVELKVINLRKEVVWVRNVVQPVYNDQNEIIGRRGVIQNITDSKNAQFELEQSKQEIQVSLELLEKSEHSKNEASKIAEIGYWEHDFITDCVIWSDYIHQIFGSNPKEEVPAREEVLEKFNKESQEKLIQATKNLINKGISYDLQLYFVNLRNEKVWVRSVAQAIYNDQNKIIGKRGVMQDITASKKAQAELEHSRQAMATSLNLLEKSELSKNEASKVAKIGFLEDDIATETYVWSEHLYHIFGFDPKEKVPSRKEIEELFDEESIKKMADATLELDSNGIPFDLELKLINLRNEEIWARIVVEPVYNKHNEIVKRRGVFQDITASKKVQLALENSLDNLERSEFAKNEASKIAKIGYHEYEIATDTFFWSDYVYHIFGFDPKNGPPSRKEIENLLNKESREKMEQATLKVTSTGVPFDIELRLINLRNEDIWVRLIVQPVYNEKNEIDRRRGVVQDITASKKAQIELELSKKEIENSLYELEKSEYTKNEASKIAKIGYWEHDIVTQSYKWSDYVYHIFGLDPTDEIPLRDEIVSLFDDESKIKMKQAVLDFDLEGIPFDVELKLINLRNEDVWVRLIVQSVYNDQNVIDKRRGIVQDITASKKAQLELENSLYKLEKSEFTKNEVSKVAKMGYHEYDIATDAFTWSEYLYDIFGFDKTQLIFPRAEVAPLFDEESKERMKQASLDLDLKGTPYDVELKLTNLRNEEVWVRNVGEPVYNEQNELVGRRGVTQDITSFKKVQLELELSKQKIETSLNELEKSEYNKNEANKVAKIGYHEYDIATDVFIWSEHLYDIFGFDKTKRVPPREEVFLLFDKESQKKMKQAIFDLDFKGIPFDIELKVNSLKNEEVWVRNIAEPVYNEEKELIGRRGITQNITNFKKTQLELELSKEEIQTSLDLLESSEYSKNEASKIAKIGYHEYEIATDTFIWSDYVYRIFGFDIESGVPSRKEVMKLFDIKSRKKMKEATLELDVKGVSYDLELKLINRRNKTIWIRIIAQPVYNEQNEIVKRRGILQDITTSKDAQLEIELSKEEIQISLEKLGKSERSKNEASRMAKIGHLEYDIATDVYNWSEYLYDIFGFDPKEEFPKRNEILALYDKESQIKITKAILELETKGTPYDVELKFINRRKEEVWARSVVQPIYNDQNVVIGRRGTFQNITASKVAQLALEASRKEIKESLELLKRSEYSLKESSKVAKIAYHEYDVITDTLILSDYVYEILGFDMKNGVPTREECVSVIDKEFIIGYEQAILELVSTGNSFDIELKIFNQIKKEDIWVRNVVQPVYNEQNEIIGRRGVMQDITASKVAQLALEASKLEIVTSLDLLAETKSSMDEASKVAKLGYHEYDATTDTYIWSDYVFHVFGLDLKDPVPTFKEILLFYDKESQIKIEKSLLELDTKGVPYDAELKLFNPKKEEEIWIRNVVQPVYNEQNKIIGRRGVMQDITERKKIEAEHLRIKDNYRRLFENATISIWNEDLTGVFKEIDELRKLKIPNIKIYLEQHPDILFSLLEKVKVNTVNKATLELFKAKNYEQFLGNIQNTFGKGAYRVFGNLLESIWNNEKTFTAEVNFKTLEGDEFIALFSVSIPQTKLEQKSVPASIQSIQSIKDAESEKRKSIEKLKEAEKLANVGSWVFDVSDRKSTWSEEMFFIWDFDLKKGSPGLDMLLTRIHKDDLDFFNSTVDKAITKGIPYDIEFRICPPNDEEKWIRGICQPILGDNGDVISLTGSNQDITEQKLATSEIEKAEEMYSLLTNNSNDLICLQELDSTFTYISPSIKNLLGYEQSDFLGKQVFELVHKDDIQPLADAMEQRVANGVEDAATFRVRHKQGHYIWLESLSSPVYKDNEISYFVTSSRDVTEWVIARQKIQKYQTSLQQMTTEMTLIEEKQKKEIASNIHDHLSQSLVISKMKINELKKKSELKIINEDLKFIESHISEALENSRKITYELSPPVLYQLGIIDALNWLLENVEATHNIKCIVKSNVNSIKLSDANSILLYRCIQEVIKNAVKYANASLITLNLDKNKFGINIVLTDNGDGFDTLKLNNYQNHSGSGFGLFAVQERVKNIQGEFTITSEINTGTSVKIFIPLAI